MHAMMFARTNFVVSMAPAILAEEELREQRESPPVLQAQQLESTECRSSSGSWEHSESSMENHRNNARFRYVSLTNVSSRDWEEIFRLLSSYTRALLNRMNGRVHRSHAVAMMLVDSVRSGERKWNSKNDPNLLLFLFAAAKFNAFEMAAMTKPECAEKTSLKPRHRRRGSGVLSKISGEMNVQSVIENLPMVALLVSRLNHLLNPVANPIGKPASESADDSVQFASGDDAAINPSPLGARILRRQFEMKAVPR